MIAPSSTCGSAIRLFKIEQTRRFLLITLARQLATRIDRHCCRGARTEPMKFGFDIFRQLDDGSPLWIANAETREQAERQMASLHRVTPARYFIRDAETGAVVSDCGPGNQKKRGPAG
jgi:hypothetical protein